MRRFLGVLLLAAGGWALGCGGDGGGGNSMGPGPSGDTSMSATIDGQAWTSDEGLVTVTGNPGAPRQGVLFINGFEIGSGTGVSFALAFITGPDTYPLGVNINSNAGGTGTVSKAPNSWLTPLSATAGTVAVTVRTANRIAGTFSFTASLQAGTGPPTTVVTNGSFDVTVAGGLPALPTGTASVVEATLGGTPWSAATIVGLRPGSGLVSISASNTGYSLTITPKVVMIAGGTYGIPSHISLTIIRTGTTDSWSATTGADVGSLMLDALTASRAVGTFSGVIPGLGATSALNLEAGTFDVHLN